LSTWTKTFHPNSSDQNHIYHGSTIKLGRCSKRKPDYTTKLRKPDYTTKLRKPDYTTKLRKPDYTTKLRKPTNEQTTNTSKKNVKAK
jgi:hypothetical protein